MGKKSTQNIPKNESKKDRFKRVCKPRVQKAMKGIRLIGLCASNNYESDKKDVKAIMDALTKEVAALQLKFEQPTKTETIDFNF